MAGKTTKSFIAPSISLLVVTTASVFFSYFSILSIKNAAIGSLELLNDLNSIIITTSAVMMGFIFACLTMTTGFISKDESWENLQNLKENIRALLNQYITLFAIFFLTISSAVIGRAINLPLEFHHTYTFTFSFGIIWSLSTPLLLKNSILDYISRLIELKRDANQPQT